MSTGAGNRSQRAIEKPINEQIENHDGRCYLNNLSNFQYDKLLKRKLPF